MVLHGADRVAAARKELKGHCVERLDPAGIDDCCRDTPFFQFLRCWDGEFTHVAQCEDRSFCAVADDLRFADFEKLGLFCGDCTSAGATRVADGCRAVMVGNRPEHVRKFCLVSWLHVDDSRNRAQIGDVEEPVVRGAVVA